MGRIDGRRRSENNLRLKIDKRRKGFNLAEPEKYGGVGKPSAYLKNLLHDAPELFVCFCLAGMSYIGLFAFYKYEQKHGIYRGTPYKAELIVIRPDDELVDVVIK